MNWIKTKDRLPSPDDGQVDVLMYSSHWACLLPGICTTYGKHWDWMFHDTGKDKYQDIEEPEFWCLIELPTQTQNKPHHKAPESI